MKKIKYLDPSHDIWNTSFKLNLLKDTDNDGKPNWIDCKPYNAKYQDDDDESILRKMQEEKEMKKERQQEEKELKRQEKEDRRREEREQKQYEIQQQRKQEEYEREQRRQEEAEQRELQKREARKTKEDIYEERVRRAEKMVGLGERTSEVRKRQRKLEHPHLASAERAGSRLLKAGYKLAREGARSYAKTTRTMKRQRPRVRLTASRRVSFVQPRGQDISLSGAIARADWSGGRNIMNTEFFGEREDRNLLGDRNKEINLTSTNKKGVRYF